MAIASCLKCHSRNYFFPVCSSVYEDEKGGVKLYTHEGTAKRIPAVLFKDSVWQVRLCWPTCYELCSLSWTDSNENPQRTIAIITTPPTRTRRW